jgi:NAD(P)-dependent dehydrogenase (short-subunit alcohol dehydrogenase family)
MAALDGKVALVTGGASGIGLATARLLAERGARIAVADRNGDAAEEAASELGGMAVEADVSRSEEWPGIMEQVAGRFGGVDLAHLNAGITTGEADISRITDEVYRREVGVNVDGVFFGARAVVPSMTERGGGAIVATASLAGLIGFSPDPVYCMTKHAVVGLVRSLGPQLVAAGITVNAVCPGLVDTPLIADARAVLEQSGFPLIEASAVATAVVDRLAGTESGDCMVVQAGRPAVAFRFPRPPGPGGDAAGRLPPSELAAHDQG